jgi:hypothetical protein
MLNERFPFPNKIFSLDHFEKDNLVLDHIKMTCRSNELPLATKDITTIICLLFVTPKPYISFDPFFSHVFSPHLSTR